jgi:hypothetical protein
LQVLFKEGVKVEGPALESIIEGANCDVRQVLNNLQVMYFHRVLLETWKGWSGGSGGGGGSSSPQQPAGNVLTCDLVLARTADGDYDDGDLVMMMMMVAVVMMMVVPMVWSCVHCV